VTFYLLLPSKLESALPSVKSQDRGFSLTLIHSVFSFQLSISAVHLFIGHFEKMATMATVGLRQIVRASQVVSSRGISVSAVVNKKDWSMYFLFCANTG
jgi:hypothetical protein